MIFVTAGTQAPFDRFVRIIDEIAADMDEEIVVQAFKDRYTPQHVKMLDFLPPDEYAQLFSRARLIVAHAGMGTIISAMEQHKPVIVMPRIAAMGEHRNEHQMATARQMERMRYAYVAYDADTLRLLVTDPHLTPLHDLPPQVSPQLINSLRHFIG